MPGNELTLSISGIKDDEIKSINIVSDNEKVVKIESYDKKLDGSDIKIQAKAVGVGNATITCILETTNGQKATQKLNVVVRAIREFKADEFVVIAKDGGKEYGADVSKIKIVSKHDDIILYGKIDITGIYSKRQINPIDYFSEYISYRNILNKTVKLEVYLSSLDSTPQAILDGVKVIKEGDPFPWQESVVKFKAEDFSLSFDDQGWGGMLMLNCTNADANKIKTFALYDSSGKSLFYDPEFVPFDEGGFISTVPADGTEYTLKVFADEDGNSLLYEGKIKFTK